MTTERLYLQAADEIVMWLRDNPTEANSIESRWIIEELARKLNIISGRAADEDEAAYQTGYDMGYGDGFDRACEEKNEEIQDLENQITDLEERVADMDEKIEKAFIEGVDAGSRLEELS